MKDVRKIDEKSKETRDDAKDTLERTYNVMIQHILKKVIVVISKFKFKIKRIT